LLDLPPAGTGSVARISSTQGKTTMLKITPSLTAAILFAASSNVLAEEGMPAACGTEHMVHNMAGMTDTSGMSDVQKAYAAAMDKMHPAMAAGTMAEDPDVAFVCGMIPHHQGAIDMARIELQYGKEPWAKEFAQKVIDAQTQEIADMRKWLDAHAK
jgi:uncharacterized protein (DUF305 family)